MSQAYCPLCNQPVQPDDRSCPYCGVDLALITSLYAEALVSTGEEPRAARFPVSPEVLVPRLGERLVEKGALRDEQLEAALQYQKEQAELGTPVLVGQALIKLGMVDAEVLDRTITQQIIQLQEALRQANRELETRVGKRTRDLRQALNQLTELNQLKANFIANISHELRTPLTHIKGYTEMLSDASLGPVCEEQISAFSVMGRSIRRLESLINDLIRFSDSAQGEIELRLQPCSVRHVFKRAISQAQARSNPAAVEISIDLAPDLAAVFSDLDKITWVIFHLIDNAIKFTPAGGQITVAAQEQDGRIRISVSDTGIGIPAEKMNEIFEPFHQLDAASDRKYGGTGLGLALVKRILQAHHTAIRVESVIGRGSTFSFHLPVTDRKRVA